jgi:phenylpropionate dioxygenase-like ring-hydroxylating dioxygenase large terminal subunit
MPEGRRSLVSIIASPISTKRMRRYAFSSEKFRNRSADDSFREVMRTVIEQDRVIVENQRPEELPIDLSEELHLKGPDAGTLEYRRMLGELGLK